MKKEEEYEVINISSSEFINQLDFLQDNYDIIRVDFPGNLKQKDVYKRQSVLRSLGLLENLEQLVPEIRVSPIELKKLQGRPFQ